MELRCRVVPFRLGVITDEISPDLERALDVMLDYDIREVELRDLWGKNVLKLDSGEMARAKKAIGDRGMSVCSIASPFYKCALDVESRVGPDVERKMHGAAETSLSEQWGLLERACELAKLFGAGIVRVFAFWRDRPLTPAVYSRIEEAFEAPLRLAEREGLVLGLENEHACLLGTGGETAPLVRKVDSPFLRCVWDPGNAFQLGEKPYPEGYTALKDLIAHIHVKDARRIHRADGKVECPWMPIGKGEIDYLGQFSALVEDGYSGVVSLETHYRNAAGDPEVSSRECLDGIRNLLSRLAQ